MIICSALSLILQRVIKSPKMHLFSNVVFFSKIKYNSPVDFVFTTQADIMQNFYPY